MRYLLVLLLIPSIVFAEPMKLVWDPVTTDTNGQPLAAPPKYRLYRKLSTSDRWKVVAEREGAWYTWYLPQPAYVTYTYRVTAFNEAGESAPSNELTIWIDTKPTEEP